MEKTEFSIQIDTAEEPMKQEEAVSKFMRSWKSRNL